MKNPRRKILQGALAGVVLTMLFPPFVVNPGGNKVYSDGFHFIFFRSGYAGYGTVDISLLLTEWLAIAIVCGTLWMLTRDPKTPGILTQALSLFETSTNAKIEATKELAEAAIEVAERLIETNANAKTEAAKITADAAIYTVNVQNQSGN